MTLEELKLEIEFARDCIENPLYDPLEVGFRHRPLTKDEMIERYRMECYITHQTLKNLYERIEKEGIDGQI